LGVCTSTVASCSLDHIFITQRLSTRALYTRLPLLICALCFRVAIAKRRLWMAKSCPCGKDFGSGAVGEYEGAWALGESCSFPGTYQDGAAWRHCGEKQCKDRFSTDGADTLITRRSVPVRSMLELPMRASPLFCHGALRAAHCCQRQVSAHMASIPSSACHPSTCRAKEGSA
jgi:hypothetical protein